MAHNIFSDGGEDLYIEETCGEGSNDPDTTCPLCGSVNPESACIGLLGSKTWYRCVYCGAEYSI